MNGVTIVLQNGIAASGVAYDGENYFACDGFSSHIFEFDAEGRRSGEYCTVRPYRTLRYDAYSNGFLAVGSGCGNTVYFLDGDFVEYDAVSSYGGGAGAIRYVGVSLNGAKLDLTYDDRVTRCERGGEYIATLALASEGTYFLGYDEYTEGTAVAKNSCNSLVISVNNVSLALPCCTSFRGFMPFADKMYAAIGRRYLYTSITEIADGAAINFFSSGDTFFSDNGRSGCCNIRFDGV